MCVHVLFTIQLKWKWTIDAYCDHRVDEPNSDFSSLTDSIIWKLSSVSRPARSDKHNCENEAPPTEPNPSTKILNKQLNPRVARIKDFIKKYNIDLTKKPKRKTPVLVRFFLYYFYLFFIVDYSHSWEDRSSLWLRPAADILIRIEGRTCFWNCKDKLIGHNARPPVVPLLESQVEGKNKVARCRFQSINSNYIGYEA